MPKIKIISNPYKNELFFESYNENNEVWESIGKRNPNSELRTMESSGALLFFNAQAIIDLIISEYYIDDKMELLFEGTDDEFKILQAVCASEHIRNVVSLKKGSCYLKNARFIIDDIKKHFNEVYPMIKILVQDNENSVQYFDKISENLNGSIPICLFGRDASLKSAFLNALIGYHILPYNKNFLMNTVLQIRQSMQDDLARIQFPYCGGTASISLEADSYIISTDKIESDLRRMVDCALTQPPAESIWEKLHRVLNLIYDYLEKNYVSGAFGGIIDLSIPFPRRSELWQPDNLPVLITVPEPDSFSNMDCSRLLNSMNGFSIGIPIWITSYTNMNNYDFGTRISDIAMLDQHFALTIIKVDNISSLPSSLLSDEQEKELSQHDITEDFSGKSFFISSYSDSSLRCVEAKLTALSRKYIVYDKCQIMNSFVHNVIDQLNDSLKAEIEKSKKDADLKKAELENGKQRLLQKLLDKEHTSLQNSWESSNSLLKKLTADMPDHASGFKKTLSENELRKARTMVQNDDSLFAVINLIYSKSTYYIKEFLTNELDIFWEGQSRILKKELFGIIAEGEEEDLSVCPELEACTFCSPPIQEYQAAKVTFSKEDFLKKTSLISSTRKNANIDNSKLSETYNSKIIREIV